MSRETRRLVEPVPPDPLTGLMLALVPHLRAAVRAELEELRAELAGIGRVDAQYTLDETAKILRCSKRGVQRLISTGRLRAAKLVAGGSRGPLVSQSEIDRLLSEAREPG